MKSIYYKTTTAETTLSTALNFCPLRLTQLLLPKERTESNRHRQLQQQSDPKPGRSQALARIDAQVRKHAPWAEFIRRRGTRNNSRQGAEHLGRDERKEDVEAGEGLEEYHAEA